MSRLGGCGICIITIIIIIIFNYPWYSVPKGGEIKHSKLIKAAGMTTCSVHRPRKNSHAVGLRCIYAELRKAAEKAPLLSHQKHRVLLSLFLSFISFALVVKMPRAKSLI